MMDLNFSILLFSAILMSFAQAFLLQNSLF
uniref:Uncharacterized protein n=1 Tax=Arundo donax TaxID=35708 RepID=A0A0A9BFT2_ARUDO